MGNDALKAIYLLAFMTRSVSTELMRDAILQRWRSHLDEGNDEFEFPHRNEQIGLTVYISKKDVQCNGTLQPYYHLSFDVPDARPVDVFNVLADVTKQPEWLCKGCTVSMLKQDAKEKVQGTTATYNTGLLLRREFYQWSAYDAKFENETFLTGVVGDQRIDELTVLQSPLSDALVATMCYSFSKITPTPTGSHVVQMSHFDAKIPEMPFGLTSPRNLYAFIWPIMVSRIPRIISHSQTQALLKWEPDEIVVPPEFLDSSSSGPQATMRNRLSGKLRASNESSAIFDQSSEGDDARTLTIVASIIAICVCGCLLLVFCFCCCCRSTKGTRWSGVGEDVEADSDTACSEVDEDSGDA